MNGKLFVLFCPLLTFLAYSALYKNGEERSGFPLGGLGTGYIELFSSGRFGKSTVQNNFLSPSPLPSNSYIFIDIDGIQIPLITGEIKEITMFGHFPIADLSYSDPKLPFPLHLKAFSPFIKGDEENSSLPVILFRFSGERMAKSKRLKIGLSCAVEEGEEKAGNLAGVLSWRKDALSPGEELVCVSAVWVSEKEGKPGSPPLFEARWDGKGERIRDVKTEFEIGEYGAFNWEKRKQFTLPISGVGNLSAIFYNIRWDGGSCGTYYAPNGIVKENLEIVEEDRISEDGKGVRRKLRSQDGWVEILMTDMLKEGVLWRETRLKNISSDVLNNFSFSLFVNLDMGELDGAENNIGWVKENGSLLVISDSERKLKGYIYGIGNSHYFLGQWQEAYRRARENRLIPVGQTTQWRIEERENGLVFRSAGGEYAILFPSGQGRVGKEVEKGRGMAWCEWDTSKRKDIWMALSWFFPHYISTQGQNLGHYYSNRFSSAEEVGNFALENGEKWLREIEKWQGEIYSSDFPDWLKDALINGLYPIVKNSLFTKDGRFSLSESFTGCPINETLVCRFNGSFPLLLFFPELEKKVMREFARLQKEDGEIPFCFGMQDNYDSPVYHLQHPIVSTEFVLMVWRDYFFTRDEEFLKEMYPYVKKAIRFARTLDRNGDYLIEEDPQPGGLANQYYDVWEWQGVSSYVNTILLASLKATSRMAEMMGDEETKEFADEWFARAQEEFLKRLWNGRWFNLYAGEKVSETCLANQLVGQWYAYLTGLGEILPKEKISSAIRWIGRLNCQASLYGVVNGVLPDGRPDESGRNHQSDGISPGEGFAFAATAIFAGEKELGLMAGEKIYHNIVHLRKSPWNIYFNYLPSTGEECWGSDYYSNMSVWTIAIALKGGKMK